MPAGRRVVLVTGASSGIGLATARSFAGQGARVHIADLHPSAAGMKVLRRGGGRFYRMDVSSEEAVREAVADIARHDRRLDVLVANAGISEASMLWKIGTSSWERVLSVNLTGTFFCFREAAALMKRQSSGRIIAVSSTQALKARPGLAAYAATKAGLLGLVRAAARDLGPYGVTVNAVAPGPINTRLLRGVPQERLRRLKEETCLGRLGRPGDVAAAVVFLASGEASFITGVVLRVDGGLLA